ncbi:hypothetical protein [Chrysiogenes arsenatis]|uniref:hypothetical protein n=1 Tax=Chrysiogenes arsenatis TaxID=309797 RepID=UPI00041EFF55|nr:hypothetical protein [Chrysiogenes arsenatis]
MLSISFGHQKWAKWDKFLQQSKFESYILDLTETLLSANAGNLSEIFGAFHKIETVHSVFQKPQFAPIYAELFAIIRDQVFIPLCRKQEFNYDFLWALQILRDGNIRPQVTSISQQFRHEITIAHQNLPNNTMDKFILSNVLLFLDVLDGHNWDETRVLFTQRYADVITHEVVQGHNDLNVIRRLCHFLYKNLDDAIFIFRDYVYSSAFWEKDELTQKANIFWAVSILWNVYNAETNWLQLYEKWLELFLRAIDEDRRELVFFLHYPLSHVYFNLTHTQDEWKKFNDEVEIPLSHYVELLCQKIPIAPVSRECKGSGSLKIAYVYDRLVGNSPGKLLVSHLQTLCADNQAQHQYYVYDIGYIEKSHSDPQYIDMVRQAGAQYINAHTLCNANQQYGLYYNHFEKCLLLRNHMIDQQIDVMIACNNRETFNFLFASRSAPIQIYWCHGNFKYDVSGIDKRITHIGSKLHDEPFIFHRFALAQDQSFLGGEKADDLRAAQTRRQQFPPGTIILGSIGRYIKLESRPYLEAVATIMQMYPQCIYLACGGGGEDNIRTITYELGIADRFYFEGWVDANIYAHIIDVYLNTFPLPSGESVNEYLVANNGAGVVSFRFDVVDPDDYMSFYQNSLSQGLLAFDEYVSCALEMIATVNMHGSEFSRDLMMTHNHEKGIISTINMQSSAAEQMKEKSIIVRSRFPVDSVFVGGNGRIEALSADYLAFIAKLLHRSPFLIYVHCGGGDAEILRDFFQRESLTERYHLKSNVNALHFVADIIISPFAYAADSLKVDSITTLRIMNHLLNNNRHPEALLLWKAMTFSKHVLNTFSYAPHLAAMVTCKLKQISQLDIGQLERMFSQCQDASRQVRCIAYLASQAHHSLVKRFIACVPYSTLPNRDIIGRLGAICLLYSDEINLLEIVETIYSGDTTYIAEEMCRSWGNNTEQSIDKQLSALRIKFLESIIHRTPECYLDYLDKVLQNHHVTGRFGFFVTKEILGEVYGILSRKIYSSTCSNTDIAITHLLNEAIQREYAVNPFPKESDLIFTLPWRLVAGDKEKILENVIQTIEIKGFSCNVLANFSIHAWLLDDITLSEAAIKAMKLQNAYMPDVTMRCALAYALNGKAQKALEFLKKVTDINNTYFSNHHPAVRYNVFSLLFAALGRQDIASYYGSLAKDNDPYYYYWADCAQRVVPTQETIDLSFISYLST